ncbi:MAG: NupC/NupG family nucleoside CNT transporter [Endozoicomonas sp.]
MQIIMSLVGMATILALAVLLSDNRKAINLRTVGGAFALQAVMGAFVLYIPVGQVMLEAMTNGVNAVLSFASDGIGFVFGDLANFKLGFIFAVNVLPVIVFFASLVAVLYYLGIMQFVIKILGGGLQKLLGTSRTESLSAAANIFVGQTEAPLLVKPYISRMTNSELFAIMVGGVASIAGTVMAGIASMGVDLQFLIAASFMAAPGGLLMAKIIKPETETPKEFDKASEEAAEEDKPANIFDAAATGAASGMKLAALIGAMLIAFISLIAMGNGILGWFGGLAGFPELTIELILGYIFSPLAFLIGVPWAEALDAGSFLGQKIVLNEFVAFSNFATFVDPALAAEAGVRVFSEHTQAIMTFALCGFANLSSIAILLGGLGAIAPNRRQDIARFGLKAVTAGTLSNLMSATIAGLFLAL